MYIKRVGTSLSQLANTVLLNGDPDESICGRSYRRGYLEHSYVWYNIARILDGVFLWDEDHCKQSYELDLQRAEYILTRRDRLCQ